MKTLEKMIWNLNNMGYTPVLSDYYLKKMIDYAIANGIDYYVEEIAGRKFIYKEE